MSSYFRYTEPMAVKAAAGQAESVYQQIAGDFGLIPEPFTLHSPAPDVLAGVWSNFRETLVCGNRARGEKEAIATAISESNRCPWCADAHTAMLHATGYHRSSDPQVQALIDWAAGSGRAEGLPAPFSQADAPELGGTALTFYFLTRMVTVFLVERMLPENGLVRGALQRVGGLLFAKRAAAILPPGESLALLPAGDLPAELAWMADNPTVAGAFARLHSAVEEAAAPYLSDAMRRTSEAHLREWNGGNQPLSRSWIQPVLAHLPADERAVAQVALLTALAPHQMCEPVVAEFRAVHPGDEALIAVAAWGAFAATRRIGAWMGETVRAGLVTA